MIVTDFNIAYSDKGLLADDLGQIIEQSQRAAYRSVNAALVYRNWLIGKRIAEEELKGGVRAEYGKQQMEVLSSVLTAKYGNGFDCANLCWYKRFYCRFKIFDALCKKSRLILSWSHYRVILQIKNLEAIDWYLRDADVGGWSVRTLQRNISSQYYERTLLSKSKDAVKDEMVSITKPLQDKLEFIKNPGQMDMYVRMYDQLKRGEGDNPTLGILLCSDTDSDIARYSVLHGNEQ